MKSRVVIYIFNLVIAALCVASIILYFLYPLWKFSFDYTMQGEDLKEMIDFEEEELGDALDGKELHVSLAFEVESIEIVNDLTERNTEAKLQSIVRKNADMIVDELLVQLTELSTDVIHDVTSNNVNKEIKNQVQDYLQQSNSEITSEETQELLDAAGVTDEFLTAKTDSVLDAFQAEGSTVDSVTDAAVTAARETFDQLRESGVEEFADLEFTEENEQSLRESVGSVLENVANEDGTIDTEEFIAQFLLEILKSVNGSNEANGEEETPADEPQDKGEAVALAAAVTAEEDGTQTTSGTTSETQEQIKEELTIFIYGLIPEGITTALGYVFYGVAGILFLSCLAWAYLLIKMIIKCFSKNPAIKLKAPIFLGWLPFLLFWVVPAIALKLAAIMAPETIEAFAFGSVSFYSSGLYAFVSAVLLIVIWIPYSIFRKKAKKDAKALKKES